MKNIADTRTEKRKLGDIGENIACDYLITRGFKIITRNYLRKWGEIDIVAYKDKAYRFIEVKSVSCATQYNVAHVTDGYRPEENVHPQKLKRLFRTIQTYLVENQIDEDFQLDVITVRMDMSTRRARVEMIENIVGN